MKRLLWDDRGRLLLLALLLCGQNAVSGNDALFNIEQALDEIRAEQGQVEAALRIIGEKLPAGTDADLDAARAEENAARTQLEGLFAAAGLPEIEQRLQAALDERNEVIISFLKNDAVWQHIEARPAETAAELAKLEAKKNLQPDQWLRLGQLRHEQHRLERAAEHVLGTHSLWRHAPGVGDLNSAAWEIILQEQRPARGTIDDLREHERRLQQAERALREHQSRAAAAHPSAAWAVARLDELTAQRSQLEKEQDELYAAVLGRGPQWQHEIEVPRGPDRRGRDRNPGKVSLWLPPDTPVVRGIILCDHIVIGSRLARDRRIRYTAAKHGLAIVMQFDSTFTEENAIETMQGYLKSLAEKSGHPELERIPLLTVGHSTGGIFARNVAYLQPDRVLGIIHIKSGNMHQHIPPQNSTLAGVPFLAINGELEDCGPEGGGNRGIRAEYNHQTQWVMIREQMLRRRREDENNLMSLLVHPGGGHSDWRGDLTQYCARFIHHAVLQRMGPPADGSEKEVRCKHVSVDSGWLSDADLKGPRHPPAPYAEYTGDKADAFWHFNEELAQRAVEIHSSSLLPDPSRHFPVANDWPGGR